MGHHRISRTAALALTLVALGAPIAAAQQDLRSPDSRDAARAATAPKQDLRSPDSRDAAASARAQERHYTSYGDPATSAALAQERYLTSYGEPEPLTRPQAPAPSDDTPWLPIALSIAAALAIVAASATQLRRLRSRRRPVSSTA
jgi:hypothetical protein